MKSLFKSPIIILANGAFPTSSVPLGVLENAGTVICTDGAINKLKTLGLIPHIIIGDLDSKDIHIEFKGLIVHDTNQYNTDLEKALEWAVINKIKKLTIIGATGLREDMTLANHYILFDYYNKIELKMITDYHTISCHKGKQTFNSVPGKNISLFVKNFNTAVSTTNLKYSLDKSLLDPSSRAISNETLANKFEVDSSGPILVFIDHLEN
jgi:thiamine pyrophosphokinase